MIHALFMWSICWWICNCAHRNHQIRDGTYFNQEAGIWVYFNHGKVSALLNGGMSIFKMDYTTYKLDEKTGFITIDSPALREDAYKSFPFVKPLWNLTYVKAKDEVLLNYPKAKEPIHLTKDGSQYVKHHRPGNLTYKTFCASTDQKRQDVDATIMFAHPTAPLGVLTLTKGMWMSMHGDYQLRDGPSEELKRIWTETMDNYTTLDDTPFMEFSTIMYYNTKLDVINMSSKSSNDFWIFEPKDMSTCTPWGVAQ